MSKKFFPSHPKHASQILKSLQGVTKFQSVSPGAHSIALEKDNGYYRMRWTGEQVNKWDWVGLFRGSSVPDDDYIGGNNWNWVEDCPYKTYTTETNFASTGIQARYLVWDDGISAYKSVATSNVTSK